MRLVPRAHLGSQRHTVANIPSMPWQDVPAFYATPVDLALRLLILTASRGTPIRMARVEQFEGGVRNIPAPNMKSSQPFRIPLSDEAQRVVDLALPLARDGFLFCAPRGKPISEMTFTALLKRRDALPGAWLPAVLQDVGRGDWTLAERVAGPRGRQQGRAVLSEVRSDRPAAGSHATLV